MTRSPNDSIRRPDHPMTQSIDPITQLFFNRQSKDRELPLAGHASRVQIGGVGQIKRSAMLAAIDLRIRTEGLFYIAAGLFLHVGGVEPALQMSGADFTFCIFFVSGALP